MEKQEASTTELVRLAGRGRDSALGVLLERHRPRVRAVVAMRLDPRIAWRVDPSDLVQEAFEDAVLRFPRFLHDRARIGFMTWLLQLARRRLIWARRQHLEAAKRCVARDRREPVAAPRPGLLSGLAAPGSSPSEQAADHEEQDRLLRLLAALPEIDRTVLRLRYAEQQPFQEIAARLGMGLSAVTMHHYRAIRRLRGLMEARPPE